jgi:hypothetical protein
MINTALIQKKDVARLSTNSERKKEYNKKNNKKYLK